MHISMQETVNKQYKATHQIDDSYLTISKQYEINNGGFIYTGIDNIHIPLTSVNKLLTSYEISINMELTNISFVDDHGEQVSILRSHELACIMITCSDDIFDIELRTNDFDELINQIAQVHFNVVA